jgi:tol-pal system protein YbgF
VNVQSRVPRLSIQAIRTTAGFFLLGLVAQGCVSSPPPEEPDQVDHLSREVSNLNRLTSDLASANKRQGNVATDLNQRLAGLEKDLSGLRGELELARHSNKRLLEHVATLEQQRSQAAASAPALRTYPNTFQAPAGSAAPELSSVSPEEDAALTREEPDIGQTATPSLSSFHPPTSGFRPPEQLVKKTSTSQAAAAPSAVALGPNGTTAEEVYNSSFLRLKSGQYEEALTGFKNLLTWFPDDSLSDNAQYWVGEVYYVQRQFPEALMAFNQVLVRWPGSDKVPASLLKIGFSFYELEDLPNAKNSLSRLIKDYPDSPAVTMAKQRLKMIEEQDHSTS